MLKYGTRLEAGARARKRCGSVGVAETTDNEQRTTDNELMKIPENLKKKIRDIPDKPGCYIMRDRYGQIVYVGKAVSLRRRVQSYFRRAARRSASPKLQGLIKSIGDVEVIVLKSEADAVLMEGRLIKEYHPKYNTFFKDDKRFLLLRLDLKQPFPRFQLCRIHRNDHKIYFGPYASSGVARTALEFIEKCFGLRKCRARVPGVREHKHCIDDIVRFCSAPCIGNVSEEEYRNRVDMACVFLGGGAPEIFKDMESAMRDASGAMNFEKAANLRDNLYMLRKAVKRKSRVTRTPAMNREESSAGIRGLRDELGLIGIPLVIEAYDVSNISGTHAVASMVVAEDGVPKPVRYRRFRIKTVRVMNDPMMMAEVIRRRFIRLQQEEGVLPDLVLVDGGLTQLRAAKCELEKLGLSGLQVAGLAKRFENIYLEKVGVVRVITLPSDSASLKVLQRIRDEAHRFALEYHKRLREKTIRESVLDEIPGIGQKRKQQLLQHFGSVTRLAKATEHDIMGIPGVGHGTASLIKRMMR